ncbi:hypothetical protein [Sphingomonas hankookensis]|uniref:hypothetical protein n=1 Tax=Sphingomonas hankookensis TaxID=563996 RepID=UPI00234E5E58|nr:hypothetical protein [Sphingomonas hankookensis]WCP71546.1 hypothetical protein PPZ50_14475 [Sphingomonas hankookensis]
MLTLPEWPAPNGATVTAVDRGGVLRGASALRVNRLGNHYRLSVTYPPMNDRERARVFVSRLIRAKRQGLRLPYPLLDVDQSQCGWGAVVDGAGQSGAYLSLRGLTPTAVIREGFWMSIEDADGQHYLHNVGGEVLVGADGRATVSVADTLLRRDFADGAAVHLVKPMIEGLVEGDDASWELAVDQNLSIAFLIEEAA